MRLLSILVLVLLAISNLGLVEAARTPAIKVIQDNGLSITVEFELQGYELEQIDVNGITCSSIKLPEQVTYLESMLKDLAIDDFSFNLCNPSFSCCCSIHRK